MKTRLLNYLALHFSRRKKYCFWLLNSAQRQRQSLTFNVIATPQRVHGCMLKKGLLVKITIYISRSRPATLLSLSCVFQNLVTTWHCVQVDFVMLLICSLLFFYIYIRWWYSENLGSEKLQGISQCCHEFNKLLSKVSKITVNPRISAPLE